MSAAKPLTKKDAKVYCGRKVRKAFVTRNRQQFFNGTVVDCPFFHGEFCYSIEYEDNDREDVAWEELVQIMLPDPGSNAQPAATEQGGLADNTNRRGAAREHNQAADTPAGQQPAKKIKREALETPPTDEGEPEQLGTAAQQPRMQRHTRTRKRDPASPDENAGPGGSGQAAGDGRRQASIRTRLDESLAGQAAAEDEAEAVEAEGGDDEVEPPPKRTRLSDVDLPQPDEVLDEPVGPEGFVARTVGTAGHIVRINLQNFMCHANFEIDFGTHVTLVSGQNGSGKSAVMQALQICLGVTARETGRGTSLQGFIRTGAAEAKVQVTVWNTGVDAFMPELFGPTITVERVIKRAGAAAFNLLDHRKHKVKLNGEKPREVLDRMLDHFAVDASNPLTIITQDMARQFLSTGKDDAVKKYEVFMQGTLMDKTQYNIKAANADLSTILQRFEETIKAYNEAKKELTELRQRVEKLKSADKQLQDRDMLERALVWRAVEQLEEQLARARAAVASYGPEVIELYDQHILALEARMQTLEERKRQLEEDEQRHKEIINNHEPRINGLQKTKRDARLAMERARRNKAIAQDALHRLHRDRQLLNEQLEKETSGEAAEARRLVEEHQQQVTAKQAEVQEAKEALDAAFKDHEAVRAELNKLTKEGQAAQDRVRYEMTVVSGIREQLQQLAAAQGNRLAMFRAVELDSLINQNLPRFRARPIGPIGALMSVTEQRWLLSAQVAFGNMFRDYLVSCPEDAVLLRQLMQRVNYQRSSIVTVRFGVPMYEIPQMRRPANGFPSLLDIIVVQDAAARGPVLNYLIDKARPESVALVENDPQGRSVTYHSSAGQHISQALGQNGYWYRRSGNDYQWTERTFKTFRDCQLVADLTAAIRSNKEDLEQHEAQLGVAQDELATIACRVRTAREADTRYDQGVKAANLRKVHVQSQLHRLMAAAPPLPQVEDNEQTTVILTQLTSLQGELADSQMNLENAGEALRLAEQADKDAIRQAQEAANAFHEQVEEGGRIRQLRTEVADKLADFKSQLDMNVQNRAQQQKHMDNLRQLVAIVETQLQQTEASAMEVCSREEGQQALSAALQFATDLAARQAAKRHQQGGQQEQQQYTQELIRSIMDVQGLEMQLQRVNQSILRVQKDVGCSNLEELEIMLADKDKLVEIRMAAHRRIEKLFRSFQQAYDNQVRMFEKRRSNVEALTQNKFQRYMRRRNHEGRLWWDHNQRTLKMYVKPNGRHDKEQPFIEDLKRLSGGERSFTTVAFLLAIGESTDCPFRCMDEYDVFMDPFYRRMATATLLEFAYENPQYQYIFLTPQDIEAVEAARKDVMQNRKVDLPDAFLQVRQLQPARKNAAQVEP